MNKRKVEVILLLGLACVLASPSSGWAGPAEDGQKIFADKCVRCHGDDGSGNTVVGQALGAYDLRSATVQKLTDAEIYTQIDKGKANMPPFGPGLNKTQITDLIAYVRTLGKKQVAAKKSR